LRFCCHVAAIKLANKETERAYSLRCDFALDFVERGGRSHPNQFKTTYYPSTVMEYHLFFSSGQNVPSRED
jgi:hypothetical protein